MARYSRLNRLYLTCKLKADETVTIEGNNFNYLKSVIRMRQGMELRVFNEQDGEFIAKVIELSRKSLNVDIISQLRSPEVNKGAILALSIIKPDRFIQAVTWAASFGLSTIVPIITQNTHHTELNYQRLSRCLIESIEQCERMQVPEIASSLHISEFIESYVDKSIFFADEHSMISAEGSAVSAENISYIKNIKPTDEPVILIGPEGGFTKCEREELLTLPNLIPICLGEAVLRSEIAAVTAVSLLQLLRT